MRLLLLASILALTLSLERPLVAQTDPQPAISLALRYPDLPPEAAGPVFRTELVDGTLRLTPTVVRVELVAIDGWQLSGAFAAASTSDPLATGVSVRVGSSSRSTDLDGTWRTVAFGGSTPDWRTLELHFDPIEPLPPAGTVVGSVGLTLTSP
jgi:hypothetical protein